jgi:hypothetical protein
MGIQREWGPGALAFHDWTNGRQVATFGTNAGASVLPFQGWRRFKEAFPPELVQQAVTETPGRVAHIVDPFGGSGTTALAAQFLGIPSTTIEVNPFLADLIEAKVGAIDLDRVGHELRGVMERVEANPRPRVATFLGAPDTFVEPGRAGRWIFSRAVASRILAYRRSIDSIADPAIHRLFRVTLGSVAIQVSNIVVSGKGRRYRQGWQYRQANPEVVGTLFREGVAQALYDLSRYRARRCLEYTLFRGDAREIIGSVGAHDLAVFSPPYPNSFDYTDVYNVELWVLGYLDGPEANSDLRRSTLRSHVQILRDLSWQGIASSTLDRTVTELRDVRDKLWNRHLPEMIGAYAADMGAILQGHKRGLRLGGRVYMVVGDSRYAGVDVPTAVILADVAETLGYQIDRLEPCRSMRVSPQQGGRKELAETLVVLKA